jgi:hypothetical protein
MDDQVVGINGFARGYSCVLKKSTALPLIHAVGESIDGLSLTR